MRFDDAGPRTWLLAAAAGWAVLAWALALAGMGGRVASLADDPGRIKPLPPLRPASASRLGPLAQYGEIGARPLFANDRRPKPFSLQGDAEGAQSQAFDYLLTSVLITPRLQLAILQPPAGGESVRVKLGDAPESHPAWRLSALHERSAVFDGPEGQRTIDLRVFDGQGGEPPTAMTRDGQAPQGQTVGVPGNRSVPIEPPLTPSATPATPKPSTGNATTAPPRSTATPTTPIPTTQAPKPATATGTDPALTEQAQMEAIRQRIQARREQLRQQSQPPPQPPDNSR